jgi:SAM-dependent methyltransferase
LELPPRVQTLLRLGQDLYRSRSDLQAAFPNPDGPEYWYWLMWHGVSECPAIHEHLYPLPDRFLRDRIVGEGVSDEDFHRGGLVDWRQLERGLRNGGYDFERPGSVLDFGCGCARILRFFGVYANTTTFYGADVDAEAIAWCARHLDFAQFVHLAFRPPTRFASETFQGLVSFSVFSHLSEELHLLWLEELHRITAPGAILVVSTQGERVMRLILDGEREGLFPPKERLAESLSAIHANGFGFFPYETLQPTDDRNRDAYARWPLDSYGAAFVLEPYIRDRWGQLFDVLEHRAHPDGWQDFTLLRRRERQTIR